MEIGNKLEIFAKIIYMESGILYRKNTPNAMGTGMKEFKYWEDGKQTVTWIIRKARVKYREEENYYKN